MSDWLESMKKQEEELATKTEALDVKDSEDKDKDVGNEEKPKEESEAGPQPTNTEATLEELAANSLLKKKLWKCLVQGPKDSLEVIRRDPKSPLFSVTSFEELNLKPELLKGIYEMKFYSPSKIQETALPNLIGAERWNIIAQSQSGTGKTAAFVLTMLSRVDTSKPYTQCICLAPTYELALQIGNVTKEMGKFIDGLVIGLGVRGEKVQRNQRLGCHILIGTPGTVMDWCLKWKVIDMAKINVFVLDEADVMIGETGHVIHTLKIRDQLPSDCQILLFSATYNEDVIKYANRVVPNPILIRLRREEETLENIRQFYMETPTLDDKFKALCNIYGAIVVGQAMIFCATRKCASWLAEKMHRRGHSVALLSGDLTVDQRAAVIERFRKGVEKVLISTNVTARGIDIDRVGLVVNFDLPMDKCGVDFETYLHRIGRTGRFGMSGVAINMIDTPMSMQMLRSIESHFGITIKGVNPNDVDEIEKIGE